MEFMHTSNGLSNFVSKEMNDLRLDDSFAHKSQEIFGRLSEMSSIQELDNYDIFSQISVFDYNPEHSETNEDFKLGSPRTHTSVGFQEQGFEDNTPKPLTCSPIEVSATVGEKLCQKAKNSDSLIEGCALSKQKRNQKEYKSGDCGQSKRKTKGKSLRETEPSDFLSLKRKDVVYKSIFRMMRRYFCKLLEDNTGYNRKEKSLKIKHKELIK